MHSTYIYIYQFSTLLREALNTFPGQGSTFNHSPRLLPCSRALYPRPIENMDQIHIDYSLKNIPIPSKFQYKKQLVSKVASFASRLRWKAFFILNPNSGRQKKTFGFRSLTKTPLIPELKQFEDELFNLVTSIKFKPFNNTFQDRLRADKEEILRSKEVLVKADKSANIYKVSVDEYNKQMKDNITKDYRKCPRNDLEKVKKGSSCYCEAIRTRGQDRYTNRRRGIYHNQGPQGVLPRKGGVPPH